MGAAEAEEVGEAAEGGEAEADRSALAPVRTISSALSAVAQPARARLTTVIAATFFIPITKLPMMPVVCMIREGGRPLPVNAL